MAHNPGAGTAHSPPAYHPSAGRYGGPNTHPYPPPPKQQRLSPNNATSPYESPPYTNGTITNTNFFAQSSSPTQTSSAFPAPYLNGNHLPTTSAVQASLGAGNMSSVLGSGAMGPPSKPVDDRPVDVNDLGDVLAGSGVDLREEEANLVGMMRKPVIQSSLYGSPALVPTLSDLSSNYFEHSARDYPTYSQNLPGSRSSFYGAGTFNQHALTEEQLQEQTRQKQALLVRKRAELCSHHAKNSFLNIGKLAANLKRRTDRNGVQLPDNQATTEKYNNTRVLVMPAQNADTLAVVQGSLQPLIQPFSPASDIMSLFSLGCKDRIMGLVEHSIWMAKSRLETSHGEVPPEFKDIAVGQGRAGEIEVDTPSLAQSRKRKCSDYIVLIMANIE